MPQHSVTVVLPCLDEAASLPGVLGAIPAGYRALVVDNNSSDGTADVARRCGAGVVTETTPGYGAAVHAGVLATTTPLVAVLDGDGSLDPGALPALVDDVERGADMAIGRRRATPGLKWPWHARLGTAAVSWRLRTRYGLPVHDIAPMRV
ncbi:glycosyltransferase, partial [Mycobacterium sp. ITM-2017-0098]